MAEQYTESRPVCATCGENPFVPADAAGCGKPIYTCAEVYRCTHCKIPFHRDCALKHFSEHGPAGTITRVSERMRNAALELALIAEIGPRDVNELELAKTAARILRCADHVALGEIARGENHRTDSQETP